MAATSTQISRYNVLNRYVKSKRKVAAEVEQLSPDQWLLLRNLRLSALSDAPDMFLSTFDKERSLEQDDWEAEFKRGAWYVGTVEDQPIGLIGVTTEDGLSPRHFIEYMWVSPEFRRFGVGRHLLKVVLDKLRLDGVRTVFLWVLDGNDAAAALYRQVGFDWTKISQPLAARPGRSEVQMMMRLR